MSHSSKKIIIAALIGNFLISISKFFAAWFTASSAMLSEGIHSLVDTGNQVLLLYGIKQSAKPADEDFPFGHGKEIYFWSFVVAILIFSVGAGVSMYEGVHRLLNPEPIKNILVNYIVLSLGIVFESVAWWMAVKEFKSRKGKNGYLKAIKGEKDPSLIVVIFEDSAAMLGLFIAMAAMVISEYTGWIYADGLASVLIGLILAFTAMWLAYETKSLLIGESANPQTVQGIKDLANEVEIIESIQEILTMHVGPDFILVNINADFKDAANALEIERAIAMLDKNIKQKYPEIKRVFIEAESLTKSLVQV